MHTNSAFDHGQWSCIQTPNLNLHAGSSRKQNLTAFHLHKNQKRLLTTVFLSQEHLGEQAEIWTTINSRILTL